MDRDFAMKWADALESGKYRQIKHRLHDGEGYCCLGVACVLAGGVFVPNVDPLEYERGLTLACDGKSEVLPQGIRAKIGMRSCDGATSRCSSLADSNDGGATFPEIADLIREHWQDL